MMAGEHRLRRRRRKQFCPSRHEERAGSSRLGRATRQCFRFRAQMSRSRFDDRAAAQTRPPTIAHLFSLIEQVIESAKLNGLNPEHYIADLLARIADHPARRIAKLLPWTWQPLNATAMPSEPARSPSGYGSHETLEEGGFELSVPPTSQHPPGGISRDCLLRLRAWRVHRGCANPDVSCGRGSEICFAVRPTILAAAESRALPTTPPTRPNRKPSHAVTG